MTEIRTETAEKQENSADQIQREGMNTKDLFIRMDDLCTKVNAVFTLYDSLLEAKAPKEIFDSVLFLSHQAFEIEDELEAIRDSFKDN